MKRSTKLTPENRAKLAGLGIVTLLALGIFGAQELASSVAPEPVAWDFRDAPSSTIAIRKPRLGLLRPLGSLEREEASAPASGPLKVRDTNPLLAGAGPAYGPRGAALYGGPKAERAGGATAEPGTSLARGGGTLQKMSLSGLSGSGGGSGASGGYAGSGASGRASAPTFGGTSGAPGAGGDGAAAVLGRKARALLGAGAQRVAAALGSQAVQSLASSIQGQGAGAPSGYSVTGTGASAPSAGAGVSAANAGNVGGGPVNAVETKLAAPAKITDTKEVKGPDEKDEEAKRELERLRQLLNGGFLGARNPNLPNTAIGRCVGQLSVDARCRGYTCAVRDAGRIKEDIQEARDAGFATGAAVQAGVVSDIERLRPQVEALRLSLSRYTRPPCALSDCAQFDVKVREAEERALTLRNLLDQEMASLQAARQGLRGDTRASLGPNGRFADAAKKEEDFLAALATLRTHAQSARTFHITIVPDPNSTPPGRNEPAAEQAQREFTALVGVVEADLGRFEGVLSRSWCARHACTVPSTDDARRALREHIDSLDVFEDFLGDAEGRNMRKALRHLEQARQALPQGGTGRGLQFFNGLLELFEAETAAENGEKDWRGAARSACSE